jgi:hypothetical protein
MLIKKKVEDRNLQGQKAENDKENNDKGYPLYPSDEDIYNIYPKEGNINPDDIPNELESIVNDTVGTNNEKDFNDDESGSDLDIPGSELDNVQEIVGSEDEENHYYSLGGDDHEDLDEDKGD